MTAVLSRHKPDTYYARNREKILAKAAPLPRWRRLHSAAKNRAKAKGIPFALTHRWVQERLLAGTCEVTGATFALSAGKPAPLSASIDRIDSSKGYTPENSRMVIWAFNRMKGDMSDDETFAIAKLVAGCSPTV